MSIIVKAKCLKNVYKNGDYRIFSWSPIEKDKELKLSNYFTFSTKGNDSYIQEQKEYTIELEEISYDSKWGATYKILSCPSLVELNFDTLTRDESFNILMDCTSSERIANNILDAYEDFIKIILTEGKESIDLNKIKGVGEAYLNSYSRELNEKYKYIALINKLKDFQIDVGDCKALYSVYDKDEEIVSEIEKNPYKILIGVLKRSFENADKMILELRDDLTHSEERCSYLILSVLETNESYGNTKCNANVIYDYIIKNYTQAKDIKDLIVPTVLNNKELFYYDEETKDLAILNTYLGECQIASLSVDKNEEPHILDIDWKSYKDLDDFHLTDEQLGALENFCNYDFTILCGKSGSGKTSTMKALVKLMEDNDMSYSLLSPTGSASLRLKEQTHRPASTIHRKVLRDGKINSDVIIVDEMSMVSLDVFVMLINAISNKDCKIVLCGDDSQLPSISKGKVFNDLIESNKVPKTILTKVFRYDTNGGAFVGENIRLGRQFLNNEKVKVKGNIYNICGNYKFVQTENIFENVISEYKSLLKKYKPNEIMILSAYNIGDCGTYKLNQTIEDEYNPPKANEKTLSYKINGVKINFRVGSRVVNTKNNYNALPLDSFKEIQKSNGKLTEEDVRVTELFNGQIGVVAEVQDDYLVCQFDEELIVIDKHKLNTLLLARAISIHRSQGSEYKAVINIISPQQSRNLSKNLLYVSDTRAKEYHCDIGDRETFEKALLVDSVDTRKTWLKDLLITS